MTFGPETGVTPLEVNSMLAGFEHALSILKKEKMLTGSDEEKKNPVH